MVSEKFYSPFIYALRKGEIKMQKEIKETNVYEEIIETIKSEDFLLLEVKNLDSAIRVVTEGFVKFLANLRYTEDQNSSAIRISDRNGSFILGVIADHSKDDEGKDSFEISFTIEEEDIKDIEPTYELSNSEVQVFLNRFMYTQVSHQFQSNEMVYKIMRAVWVNLLAFASNVQKKELDEEGYTLKINETLNINVNDEDGKRVITIEPGTDLKKFIKDDSLIQIEA